MAGVFPVLVDLAANSQGNRELAHLVFGRAQSEPELAPKLVKRAKAFANARTWGHDLFFRFLNIALGTWAAGDVSNDPVVYTELIRVLKVDPPRSNSHSLFMPLTTYTSCPFLFTMCVGW
jgi:hypothetical protein